jgi:hypothetical protein
VLEHPPSFHTIEEEEEDEEDEGDLDDGAQSEQDENDDDDDDEEEPMVDGDEAIRSESAEVETDDMEDILNPLEFDDYPAQWNVGLEAGSRVRLSRNYRLSEITAFYKNGQDERHQGIFVLNVNYAGNEMHQSVVRVIPNDNVNSFVHKLYDWERKSTDEPLNITISEEDFFHTKFLIIHGYMHVVG